MLLFHRVQLRRELGLLGHLALQLVRQQDFGDANARDFDPVPAYAAVQRVLNERRVGRVDGRVLDRAHLASVHERSNGLFGFDPQKLLEPPAPMVKTNFSGFTIWKLNDTSTVTRTLSLVGQLDTGALYRTAFWVTT